jgi:hypothetical protein
MIVIAIGVLGMAPLVVLSTNTNNISRDVLDVSELAKEQIEFYENTDSLPSLPYYLVEQDLGEGVYDRLYDRTTYIWDNATDTLVPPGMCHIQVKVAWTDMHDLPHSTVFTTVLEK